MNFRANGSSAFIDKDSMTTMEILMATNLIVMDYDMTVMDLKDRGYDMKMKPYMGVNRVTVTKILAKKEVSVFHNYSIGVLCNFLDKKRSI